jgi:hypothetical protein
MSFVLGAVRAGAEELVSTVEAKVWVVAAGLGEVVCGVERAGGDSQSAPVEVTVAGIDKAVDVRLGWPEGVGELNTSATPMDGPVRGVLDSGKANMDQAPLVHKTVLTPELPQVAEIQPLLPLI